MHNSSLNTTHSARSLGFIKIKSSPKSYKK